MELSVAWCCICVSRVEAKLFCICPCLYRPAACVLLICINAILLYTCVIIHVLYYRPLHAWWNTALSFIGNPPPGPLLDYMEFSIRSAN